MFEYIKEDLDLEISFNSFKQEVFHKTILIQRHNYQFERFHSESKNKAKSQKSTIEFVKFCRKIIEDIERIIISFKSYLNQLNLQFLYDVFYKMFKILVASFNGISKKFMNRMKNQDLLQNQEANKESCYQDQKQNKQNKCNRLENNTKDNMKQIEYFDFIFKGLEEEGQKLDNQRKLMEIQFKQECKSLRSINASDTVNQLQNLNKDIQKIINNSYQIAGQNVLYRCQQLSKRIVTLKKPEQLKQQFCDQFSTKIKSKFITTMERIIRQIYYGIRHKEKQKLIQQIIGQKPIVRSMATQTQSESKMKQIQQLNKERKALNNQIQNLKKSNNLLQRQAQKFAEKFKQSKEANFNLQKKVDQLDDKVRKKTIQLSNTKLQCEKLMENLTKSKFMQSGFQQQARLIESPQMKQSYEVSNQQLNQQGGLLLQTNLDKIQLKLQKSKSLVKQKTKNSTHSQKLVNIHKKQNSLLKDAILSITKQLRDLKLMDTKIFDEVNQNMKTGELVQLVHQILQQIPEKIKKMANNRSSLKTSSRNTTRQNMATLQMLKTSNGSKKVQYGLQANAQQIQQQILEIQCQQQERQIKIQRTSKIQTNSPNTSSMPSKLDSLKKQFLQKVSMNKKHKQLVRSSARKYMHKYHNIQTKASEKNNNTVSHLYTEDTQQIFMKRTQQGNRYSNQRTSRPVVFNKNNICFEQFKINKIENKSTHLTPKNVSSKRKQNVMTEETAYQQKNFKRNTQLTNKPIISLQNYEVLKQVKLISDMISHKNDKNNYFLKSFIQNMFQQLKKMKGKPFIEQILRKQVIELEQKTCKTENKINRPKNLTLQINNIN